MGKRVLVILGAGAAFDLVPTAGGRQLATTNEKFHPPLTEDIFQDSPLTKETLDRYAGARILAASIRVAVHNGQPLEPFLKQLADAHDKPRAQQFLEIPLYLQDLFGRISANFTNQPFNYAHLADKLFAAESDFEYVAFVTLNYDTLLEQVLDPYYLGAPIRDMRSYVTNRCMLIKLHGSVNWARRLLVETRPAATYDLEDYLGQIRSIGNVHLSGALSTEILLRNPDVRWNVAPRSDEVEAYYPVLSVPLGEYRPVCPDEHIEALKGFLGTCRNVLIIGVSGRDNDLLDILRDHLPEKVSTLVIVDANKGSAEAAQANFRRGVPQLRINFERAEVRQLQTDGFGSFILSGKLDNFIATCE